MHFKWLDHLCGYWKAYFGEGHWSFSMRKYAALKLMHAFNCEYIEKVRGWGVGKRVYNNSWRPPEQDPFNPLRKRSVRKEYKW